MGSSHCLAAWVRLAIRAACMSVPTAVAAASPGIYVDLHRGAPAPENAGTPSASYAAAAAQAGIWNAVTVLEAGPHPLVDTAGAPAGISLTLSATAGGRLDNNPTTSGDDAALLDDGYNIAPGIGSTVVFTVTGLAAGSYTIYTYAWDPNSPSSRSVSVDVNGAGAIPVAPSSDAFTGFEVGVTHAVHPVTLGAGENLVITVANLDDVYDQASVNGFQIVPGGPSPIEESTWQGVKALYRGSD